MGNVMTTDQKNAMTQELMVVKSVEIFTSPNHVWRVLTEPDKITQWMGAQALTSNHQCVLNKIGGD